jgi:8-oxo-dGTP pyrophosphatase MutT (NUDIX family)
MPISLEQLAVRLSGHTPARLVLEGAVKRAAVAIVVRATRADDDGAVRGLEVLMVRRADRPGDPWSGQMGFPGGREEPEDGDLERTALRETHEEIGVRLEECCRLVGRLSEIQARAREGLLPMTIMPFVYELRGAIDPRTSDEVAESTWVPLAFLRERSNRATMRHEIGGREWTLPCYEWSGRVVWGLSLAMLDELVFRVIDAADCDR